jgi:CHAD domain-containing protein
MNSPSSVPLPFAFQADEKVDRGFVRVLEELAIHARLLTQNPQGSLSESVHDARVLIKRLRALLWFAGSAFSLSELNRFKSHLRKASHLLAAQRDLVVMRTILEELSRKASKSSDRATLIRIAKTQDGAQASTGKPDRSLQNAIAIFLATIKQLSRISKSKLRWPSSSERLAQAFLDTAKSGKKALQSGNPVQFHDWRKKAKRLFFQLQLTQAVSGKRMTHTINQVDRLQEKLGDYHDSIIAESRLRKDLRGEISPRLARRSVKILEKRMHRLRKDVQKIARHIKFK